MSTRSAYQTTYNQADEPSQEYYNQLENIAKKERFGLFSQPPPLAVLDKYGRAMTPGGPRNFYTNPHLQSQVEPTLFNVPSSILQGDPYRDSYKGRQIKDQQRVASIPFDKPFIPNDTRTQLIGPQYEHMKDFDDKTYKTRDQYGNIITGPKNFQTNPTKKGLGNTTVGHLFSPVEYGTDPFHRAKEMDIKERAEHQSKVLNPAKPYCSTSYNNGFFNSHQHVYGQDRPPVTGKRWQFNYPGVPHQQCFKNTDQPRKGYNKTIGKFPDYVEEGAHPRPWKKTIPSITQGAWRPNSEGTFSRPSPSVSGMVLNRNKGSSYRK